MTSRSTLAALLAVLAPPVLAAQQTVTLAVPGMTCAVCPITVKRELTRVDGVARVDVDYDKRQAAVSFDDAKTGVAKLPRATVDAGYQSTLKEVSK